MNDKLDKLFEELIDEIIGEPLLDIKLKEKLRYLKLNKLVFDIINLLEKNGFGTIGDVIYLRDNFNYFIKDYVKNNPNKKEFVEEEENKIKKLYEEIENFKN